MALTKCKECGAAISRRAAACPQCGATMPRRTSLLTWLAAVVLIPSCIGGLIINERGKERRATQEAERQAAMTPEQRRAETAANAKSEADFQRGVLLLRALRQSMKNPASFQLESAILMPDGTYCFSYRATNSFNAIVPGYVSVPGKGKPLDDASAGGPEQWNKRCGGKTGTDMSRLRFAL